MSNLQKLPQKPAQTVSSNQSLIGRLYQVIQTPGLQGSNVLKLIPIISKDNPPPAVPAPVTPRAPALNVPGAVISSPPPPVSIVPRPSPVSVPLLQTPALGNYIIAAQSNLTKTLHVEQPFSFQEATLFLDNAQLTLQTNPVPGNPTLIMMNAKSSGPAKPTPMLPTGHSLQIPAHAEVISVPVSSLPFSIQQKILPQANCTDASKIPSVIYVSPVNTVRSSNPQIPPLYPSPVPSGRKSPPHQKPTSSRSDAAKGPMKWVVQENQESAACLVPVKSSNDTASKILQMLSKTKMEEVNLTSSDHSKVVQIKDNALVMCNNKIFFLTKKGTELNDGGSKSGEPPQAAVKPAALPKPAKDLSSKVVQVVLSKNKSPPPAAEEMVQSNVVSTARPKRKSSTPRAARDPPKVIYIHDDDESGAPSAKPPDTPSSLPDPANKGDPKNDQPLPKSEQTEILTAPEVKVTDDRSWRLKFGLLKKEKIILKRTPLIGAQGTSKSNSQVDPSSPVRDDAEDPVETQQLKRKSSSRQTVKASKKQKSTEDGDVNHNSSLTPIMREPETTERSSSTWSPTSHGGEASCPPDSADFQVNPDITGHFSDVSLPSQRFHIDSLSSMYSDETTNDEKIQRLKEVIKEREKVLEALRHQKTLH